MDPEFLTSRLKHNLIGDGFTLKKKHLDEVCKILKDEGHKHQQMAEELVQLKQQTEAISNEKQQLEIRLHEVTERLNIVNNTLQEEQMQKGAFKSECDRLSEHLKALQMDAGMKQLAVTEKEAQHDEKLQQLTQTLEKTIAEYKLQLSQQRQDYDRTCEKLSSEHVLLKRSNQDFIRNLDTAKDLQEKTEKRCKQLESDLAVSVYESEKLEREKSRIEDQLAKEREESTAKIQDLSSQLDSSKQRESKAVGDLENYKRRNKEAHIELKEVMFGQSKECSDAGDTDLEE